MSLDRTRLSLIECLLRGVAYGRAQHWPVLKGALRISTKYAIADLREAVVASLRAIWPETIFDMDLNCLPNAAGACMRARPRPPYPSSPNLHLHLHPSPSPPTLD